MSSWTVWHQHGSPIVCDRLSEAVEFVQEILPGHQSIPKGDRLLCYPDDDSEWFCPRAVIVFSSAGRLQTVEHIREMNRNDLAARSAAILLAAGEVRQPPRVERFDDLAAD